MSATPKRVAVSKKLRFEVFKRDKFVCQYCGAKAPDVVLHCDHIHPVAKGGTTDILNLITSCADCNGGKGAMPLSESATLDRQHKMLADLEERRQQIEMLVAWRDELQNLDDACVEAVAQRMKDNSGSIPNGNGLSSIKKWLKKYSLSELLEAVDESCSTYLSYDRSDNVTDYSWEMAFKKIPNVAAILRQQKEKPYLSRLFYIQGIIRKRTRMYRYECVAYLEHAHLCGLEIDDLEFRARKINSIKDFEGPIDAWLESIGREY